MYVIQCVKPGKSYGIHVKCSSFLANTSVDCEFSKKLPNAMIFSKKEAAIRHIKGFLVDPIEVTAIFTVRELGLKD